MLQNRRQPTEMKDQVKMKRTDGSLIKVPRVEHRDVDCKWDTRTSKHNSPEQGLICPSGGNAEHTPLEFPSEEQDPQNEGGENSGMGMEHADAITITIGAVALSSEVTIIASPHNNYERNHDGDAHNEPVVKGVNDDLNGEDTPLML